jgi:addiction module HigA family antidote
MSVKVHPSFAIHAGEWLRTEIVEAHGVSVNRLAEAFGVSRQAISAVLHGRSALSAEMAIRFEHAFGVKADTLMRMQTRYELAKARERESELTVESLVAA